MIYNILKTDGFFSELKKSKYVIGTEPKDGKQLWVTNQKPLEKWIWPNDTITTCGDTSHIVASADYRVQCSSWYVGVDGVICEWPMFGTLHKLP